MEKGTKPVAEGDCADARRWTRARAALAHADASGISLFEETNDRGVQAAGEVLAALREPGRTVR